MVLYIKQKFFYAYEYLYISLENTLPKEIEIDSKERKKIKFNNFSTFGSKIRKSIVFIKHFFLLPCIPFSFSLRSLVLLFLLILS